MRSGVGVFCPGSRRLECLPFTRALAAAEAGAFSAGTGFAPAEAPRTTTPPASSSASPPTKALRRLIISPLILPNHPGTAIGLLLILCWYRSGQKHRQDPVAITAPQNLEHYVRSRLQLGNSGLVFV